MKDEFLGSPSRRIQFHFSENGESRLPFLFVAIARGQIQVLTALEAEALAVLHAKRLIRNL